jgi:hypothetical protein
VSTPVSQQSFNGGEVSARLFGRTDSSIYDIAVAEMTNFAPTVEGPVVKRSGTSIVALANATAVRLIPFEFNAAQTYMLEFCDHLVRFYANGVPLLVGGVQVTVATPYAAADIAALVYQQSADVLYLTHPNYPHAAISRTGAAAFNYATVALTQGPFADANTDHSIGITSSGETGVVTLTSTTPIFLQGHIGGLFQLQSIDFADVKAWEPGMTVTSALCRNAGKIYTWIAAANAGTPTTGTIAPVHTEGGAWDGLGGNDVNAKGAYGMKWVYVCDNFGQLTITATPGTATVPSITATATVIRRLPAQLITSASWRWAFGRFSNQMGWPKHVAIWNSRLIFASDFEIFGSVVGDYRNFAAFDNTGVLQADLSFRFRLASPNPINWMVSDLQLFLGTDRIEYSIGPINSAQAPGASNLQAVKQGYYGSASVRPLQVASQTIFVQRGAHKLREAAYNYSQGRYVASNILVWARHLAKPGLIELAWQNEPEELLWALRADGVPIAHCEAPEQQVKGWSRMPIASFAGDNGGIANVLSLATKPSGDGSTDEVWMLVSRLGVKTIELLNVWWVEGTSKVEAKFLDGMITYRGAAATNIGGLPAHYVGKTVWALADGAVVQNLVVAADKSVTIPVASSVVHVGIPFVARLITLPAKVPSRAGGNGELRIKRIVNVLMRVVETLGLFAGSAGSGKLDEIIRRPQNTPMNSAPDPFTGETSNVSVGGGSDRAGQVQIESRLPYPAIITLIVATLQQSGS